MCGIVAAAGRGNILPVLLHGLRQVEYRGYDSAGVAVLDENGVHTVKTAGRIEKLEQALSGSPLSGTVGIAHTRWATHGAPETRNAHPHTGMRGLYTVVHNGIIENADTLRRELEAFGVVFRSDTDTEVFANLLERLDTGDPAQTLQRSMAYIRGSNAFCVLYSRKSDAFYGACCGAALLCGTGSGQTLAASDALALGSCHAVYRLQDGETVRCTAQNARFFNSAGEEIQKEPEPKRTDLQPPDKGGYGSFLEKELYEQPAALARTLRAPLPLPSIRPERIWLVGCGSAYHAALTGEYWFRAHTAVSCAAMLASEFRYAEMTLDRKTLVVCISQSGETADTIAAMRRANAAGAYTYSIVNTEGSTLAAESRDVFLMQAGREIAVATTKAYTAQLLSLLRLCMGLCGGKLPDTLPALAGKTLETACTARALAERLYTQRSAYFIGRGTDYPAAMEGALKLRELCYLDAHAYAAGELKHGTISLVQPGTLCVAVCCAPALADKTISAIEEVRARGSEVLCVTTERLSGRVPADAFLVIPDAPEEFLPILSVIPMQLFALFCTNFRKCDADKPRNLAKSVTVE